MVINGRCMKTFFLMPQGLDCDNSCNYESCPHRYLHSLQGRSGLQSIEILSGSYFEAGHQPFLIPQHGDIVIMFAGDAQDLEQMICHEECFEFTRNILVLGDDKEIDTSRCHQLGPRFITHVDRNVDELEAVIQRMQDKTARTLQSMRMLL